MLPGSKIALLKRCVNQEAQDNSLSSVVKSCSRSQIHYRSSVASHSTAQHITPHDNTFVEQPYTGAPCPSVESAESSL